MKKIIFTLSLLLCTSALFAKNFGEGFAWGSMFGFTTNAIVNNMSRYQQPCKPSLYIYPKPEVYVTQPQVVYYPQPQVNHTTQTHIIKQPECQECVMESNQVQLQILKEQNRKKKLALKEKKLDAQLLKLRQAR